MPDHLFRGCSGPKSIDACTHMYVHTHTHVHTYTHARTHAHTHAYTLTRMHTSTHTEVTNTIYITAHQMFFHDTTFHFFTALLTVD